MKYFPENKQNFQDRLNKRGQRCSSSVFDDHERFWDQILLGLAKIGGPAVALLAVFRLVMVPLLAVGSSPVSVVLAVSVGIFLVLCGIAAVIRVLQ